MRAIRTMEGTGEKEAVGEETGLVRTVETRRAGMEAAAHTPLSVLRCESQVGPPASSVLRADRLWSWKTG